MAQMRRYKILRGRHKLWRDGDYLRVGPGDEANLKDAEAASRRDIFGSQVELLGAPRGRPPRAPEGKGGGGDEPKGGEAEKKGSAKKKEGDEGEDPKPGGEEDPATPEGEKPQGAEGSGAPRAEDEGGEEKPPTEEANAGSGGEDPAPGPETTGLLEGNVGQVASRIAKVEDLGALAEIEKQEKAGKGPPRKGVLNAIDERRQALESSK